MEILLGAVRVIENKIKIIGTVNNPDKKFLVKLNGQNLKIILKNSGLENGNFIFEINEKADEKNEIIFPEKFGFKKWSTVNADRKEIINNGYKISYHNNILEIKKANAFEKIKTNACLKVHYLLTHQKVFLNRLKAKKTNEKIWLYCDRENLFDNAYYQFKHDIKIKDGTKKYYLTNSIENAKKYFTDNELKNVILFKSREHIKLFFQCSKIITSFSSISIFSPFGSDPTVWYYDLLDFEIIYLQHGVLHAHLPNMYSKETSLLDKIVVSTEFECENFVNNYGYNDEDLIKSGMPRYDYSQNEESKRKILLAPTWRGNLIGTYKNNTRELLPDIFKNSDFYKEIQGFLNSDELDNLLKENDLTLDFKNHPIFSEYNNFFEIKSDRITVSSSDTKIDDYLLMITDYSSMVFDFVYLKRPIVYFVPDYNDFKNGVCHNYNKLDLPLEEGFGELVFNRAELIEILKYYIENNFQSDKKYYNRMCNFFLYKDRGQCERIYKKLQKNP